MISPRYLPRRSAADIKKYDRRRDHMFDRFMDVELTDEKKGLESEVFFV